MSLLQSIKLILGKEIWIKFSNLKSKNVTSLVNKDEKDDLDPKYIELSILGEWTLSGYISLRSSLIEKFPSIPKEFFPSYYNLTKSRPTFKSFFLE